MVIYEVNISANNDIFQDYYEWLLPHIRQILSLQGFLNCEVGLVENQSEDNKNHLRISYTLDSYADLQHYLTHHAPQLRAEGVEKFGDQFSATRRIILEPVSINTDI
jgi:Domain of unknown function (DUF4286)